MTTNWRELTVHSRVVPEQATVILGNIVATLGLIRTHFTLAGHIVKVLVGVHTRLLRSGPASSVDASGLLVGVVLFDPVYQNRNGIFGLRSTAETSRNALGCASSDSSWPVVWHHGLVDVDVVRVQVVRDVALDTSPGLERLKLGLGLTHVAVEVVEIA